MNEFAQQPSNKGSGSGPILDGIPLTLEPTPNNSSLDHEPQTEITEPPPASSGRSQLGGLISQREHANKLNERGLVPMIVITKPTMDREDEVETVMRGTEKELIVHGHGEQCCGCIVL